MSLEPQKPQAGPPPFIATAAALEALALLDRGLGARKPFVLVSGEAGIGKTMLVKEMLRRWSGRVAARPLCASEAAAETFFATLLGRFGGTVNSTATGPALTDRLLEAIAHTGSNGKVVVLVVDDAHALPAETWPQLERLTEMAGKRQCALEVLLVGEPELAKRLDDPAFAERVTTHVRLSPLTQHDTRHYLLQRAGMEGATGSGMFSRKACRDIHQATFGLPRAVDALADESAKRAVRAGATTVSPEHVRSAMQSLRARRGSSPATVIAPRAERMNLPAPRPAPAPIANIAPDRPEPKPVPAVVAPPPRPAVVAPPPQPVVVAAEPPKPVRVAPVHEPAPTPQPAASNGAPSSSAEPAFPPANDQRVKDWVSRFGGAGPIRIGVGHGTPRYEQSATLDTAPPPAAGPNRKLIIDEEPPIPKELAEKIARLTRRKRRRKSNTTLQGALLAVAVALIAVVIGQRGALSKRFAFEPADTSVHPTTPAAVTPPLALETSVEPVPEKAEPVKPKRTPKPSRQRLALVPSPAPRETVPAEAALPMPQVPTPLLQPPALATDGNGRFGIVAGSFPSNDMAKAEKDHLARLTPYRVWIDKSKGADGVRTYHLMVGRFESMEHAWEAAQTMVRHGILRDANVRPLSEKEAR